MTPPPELWRASAAEIADGLTIDAAGDRLISLVQGWMNESSDA